MGAAFDDCVARRLREYGYYDSCVDVVSAFEALFVRNEDLARTCVRFDRYPTAMARTAHGDREVTPDFTVSFSDQSAIVAEIARIALPDESVDGLCEQLLRYDQILEIPVTDVARASPSHVDVVLFVPLDIGLDSIRRIVEQRLLAEEHPYKPSAPPTIVQFA